MTSNAPAGTALAEADLELALAEAVGAIVQEVGPERVYLFGSRARGDAHSGSDVDLLVVSSETFGPSHQRSADLARIRRALWRVGMPADILLYSADEVEHWKDSLNHVIGDCYREGRLLYARP